MSESSEKVAPQLTPASNKKVLKENNFLGRRRYGQGIALSILYMGFATAVAVTTYYLNSIANVPTYFGLLTRQFYTPWVTPITTLMQSEGVLPTGALTLNTSFALSNLLYKACPDDYPPCVEAFKPEADLIWCAVGQTFATIQNFEEPLFQSPNQTIKFKHISNMNGWDKASIQYYIDGHDMAITCQIRRTRFAVGSAPDTVDTLAYCSPVLRDPNWICETEVDLDVNTYAIQVQKGVARYLGVVKRGQIFRNPGKTALLSGGLLGNITLQTVRSVNMYEYDMVEENGFWDILTASDCKRLNFKTKWGWLLKLSGYITITWKCQATMLTNSIVLFIMTFYLVILQFTFLQRSIVCCAPVYMSKNVVGLVILFIVFYNNHNVQALTTYLLLNPSYNQMFYALCGPVQVASIVGIMTGTIIQIWFNPQIVTQTWIIMLFSSINFIVVFVLEGFIFPYQNDPWPIPCTSPISTNCFAYSEILQTYYVSAIVSFVIIMVAIAVIYIDEYWFKDKTIIPESNTALQYLNITDFSPVATSTKRCLIVNKEGLLAIDAGILLSKNMIQISSDTMTRSCNIQYELIYRLLPRFLKPYYSLIVGSMLAIHLDGDKITDKGTYLFLHEMGIDDRDFTTGYFA